MNKLWYVLRSKPNKEDFLTGQLLARNIEYYFPVMFVKPVNPRARKIKPYFPGYLFIHTDFDCKELVTFERIPGAGGLVYVGGEVANVPDPFLQALRSKVEYFNNRKHEVCETWKNGDRVKINAGPFEGYEAIFDIRVSGAERVRVLLTMLQGRKLRVELPVDYVSLKKAPSISW